MRCSAPLILSLVLALATPSMAQSLEERVISSLERDGYQRIVRTRTLLGRIRIVALRAGHIREVVINPSTSEILRDVEVRSNKVPDLTPKAPSARDDTDG